MEVRNDLQLFRCLLVAAQGATIVVTWPLWQVRFSPPMLPVLGGPQWNFGLLLLASLGYVLWRPRLGLLAHTCLLIVAAAQDQMRLQPEFISLTILLWGTLPSRGAQLTARVHLIALWFFAGLHKLTSPGFATGDAHWLVTSFVPNATQTVSSAVAFMIATV